MTLAVQGVVHVVLKVRDLESSLRFYRDGLGLKEMTRRDFGEGMFAFLSAGTKNHDIGLLEVGKHAPGPEPRGVGLYHVCIKVGDSLDELRSAQATLEARGIPTKDPMDHGACQSIYITDPDGNVIEITVDKHPELWRDDPTIVAGSDPLVL